MTRRSLSIDAGLGYGVLFSAFSMAALLPGRYGKGSCHKYHAKKVMRNRARFNLASQTRVAQRKAARK